MKTIFAILAACCSALTVALAADQSTAAPGAEKAWWAASNEWRVNAAKLPGEATLPLISVKGNRFVNPAGERVLVRGLAIADPDKLAGQGQWKRELFVALKDMGANVVRIPVHPIGWRARGVTGYLALLDQAVGWSTELGMYVMIDWHSIGNLCNGTFQAPMYETSLPETLNFWRTIALHYKGNHTTAFYELFNEPSDVHGLLGSLTWTRWKELNEELIGVIQRVDKEKIPIVAGLDWAYDLSPARYEPVRADNIAYSDHPYENKRHRPWEPKWEENFGYLADRYPMIATEFGFDMKPGERVDDDHYANRLTRYLERRGISWIGWCFDPDWGPWILKDFNGYTLTPSGEFFKEALQRPPVPVGPSDGKW